ncbi:hypothetical protein [Planctellipticum variicoloris]|uniref:hypothetical protein n=1 Tax=Planctellipticum variicoloris TaxID=3064265 RepID=UPI003013FBB4|nr:hypothetical protein SH412_005322 [Planctomycetaceae bacterium SH412]
MSEPDRMVRNFHLYLPLGLTSGPFPFLDVNVLPVNPGMIRLRPVAITGVDETAAPNDQIRKTLERFVSSDDQALRVVVTLYYFRNQNGVAPRQEILLTTPVRLGLGFAGQPTGPNPGEDARVLLRGGLTIPFVSNYPFWRQGMARLWPTNNPADLRAIHIEPGGIYLEGLLPRSFYPGRPATRVPVVLRVPQGPFTPRVVEWGNGSAVPTSGNGLILLGFDPARLLHLRAFDLNGDLLTDTVETDPQHPSAAFQLLKQRLVGFGPTQQPTGDPARAIVRAAMAIVGQSWTLSDDPTSALSGTSLTASAYVRSVRDQFRGFGGGGGGRSFLRLIDADPDGVVVRITADPNPFAGDPTRLRWRVERPGVSLLIGTGRSATASFQPTLLRGQVTRQAGGAWPADRDWWLTTSDDDPAATERQVGFAVQQVGDQTPTVTLALNETLVPQQIPQTPIPAGTDGVQVSRRSWLCTASGWLALDAYALPPANPSAAANDDPSQALRGMIDVTGIARDLLQRRNAYGLDVLATALGASDVGVEYRSNGTTETLRLVITQPRTTVTTGPFWASEPGSEPSTFPPLWQGPEEPDDTSIGRALVTAGFVTLLTTEPKTRPAPLTVLLRWDPNTGDLTFRARADQLTAWHLPVGLPLARNVPVPGPDRAEGWLDGDRGLVPFLRTPHDQTSPPEALISFPPGALPRYPEGDTPTLRPPVGPDPLPPDPPNTVAMWVVAGLSPLDHYQLTTLTGVEFRLSPTAAPGWVYRHANPSLDQWYGEQMTGLPDGTIGSVTWDTSGVETASTFPLDRAGVAVPALGWLPPALVPTGNTNTPTLDPAGGCRVTVEPGSPTRLVGVDPALKLTIRDAAGIALTLTFQYPTAVEPDRTQSLSATLTTTLTPSGANLPKFTAGFEAPGAATAWAPPLLRNGQPLLAAKMGDGTIVTADGLGLVRAEPRGPLTRAATPGAPTDRLGWCETVTLRDDATTKSRIVCELIDLPLTGETPDDGAGWCCHDGDHSWPILLGFPLFPIRVQATGDATGPTSFRLTAVWMRTAPAPDRRSERPPTSARNVVRLQFTRTGSNWNLQASGGIDWRFDDPLLRDATSGTSGTSGTSLARVALVVAGALGSDGSWNLAVTEIALDHTVGLLRLPPEGCTARLQPGKLTLRAQSTATDTPFAYDIAALVIDTQAADRGTVPVDTGSLTWRMARPSGDFSWSITHTISPQPFRKEHDARLLAIGRRLNLGSRSDAAPPQRAVWHALGEAGQREVASVTPSAVATGTLLDQMMQRRDLYQPHVWSEPHLDPLTRARIAEGKALGEDGVWHRNFALVRAAFDDGIDPPPPWTFTVTSSLTGQPLARLRARLGHFGANQFLLVGVPTQEAPTDLVGSWFERLDPNDRGFVAVRFDTPLHVVDLGAEIWMTLTDRHDPRVTPAEPDRTRLAARLVVSGTPNPQTGADQATARVELTGRWSLRNQVPYRQGSSTTAALEWTARVYLNQAAAPLEAVFAGLGPTPGRVLGGVAHHTVREVATGKQWDWQAPQTVWLRRLGDYLGLPANSTDADATALVVDASQVAWLAPFATTNTPARTATTPPRPALTAAGLDLQLLPPQPQPFDAIGGHEVRLAWATGAKLAGRPDLPVVALGNEPPDRSYPEAGIHPRRPRPPVADTGNQPRELPRDDQAAWLASTYLAETLWPGSLRDRPAGSGPTVPADLGNYSDLAWLLASSPARLAAAVVVRQHDPAATATLPRARTLVNFPFDLNAVPTQGDNPSVNRQLLLYDRGVFRRVATAEGPADDNAARAWGLSQLLQRRVRAAGLVVVGFDRLIPVASPLGVVDEPLAGVRPWDRDPDPANMTPDPARHLPLLHIPVQPTPGLGVLLYDARPVDGPRVGCRFTPDQVNQQAKRINVPGHGLGDGQELAYVGPDRNGVPVGGLTPGHTYYVIGASDDAFGLADRPRGAAIELIPGGGTENQFLIGPRTESPSATLFRLSPLGEGSPGTFRPATAVTLATETATLTLSRLDRVAFTAATVGYPATNQDLNHARVARAWPVDTLRSGEYFLPPQIDVTSWATRPGEVVTSQWSTTRDDRRDGQVARRAGPAPAVSLRRPRASVGAHQFASVALDGATRSLMGGAFTLARLLLNITLGQSPRPDVDGVATVLVTRRAVHPGFRSPEDAREAPIVVEFKKDQGQPLTPGVALQVIAGARFNPQILSGNEPVVRTLLLRLPPTLDSIPMAIQGDLDNGLTNLHIAVAAEFTAGPGDTSQWDDIGGGLARFHPPIGLFPAVDGDSTAAAFELSRFERVVQDNVVASWTRTTLGGCLRLTFAKQDQLVPDAPSNAQVLINPAQRPDLVRLLGVGRIAAEAFGKALPVPDPEVVWWRGTASLRALYRSLVQPGEGADTAIRFGIRLNGPTGESVPHDDPTPASLLARHQAIAFKDHDLRH